MKPWPAAVLAVLMMTAAVRLAPANDRPVRIWILPFQHLQQDSSLAYLEDALPALLTVALSRSDAYVVVDRQQVDRLLDEQSLTLEGLISEDARHQLLGATVMVTGSFVREDPELLVTMRASDLETGIVILTAEARGSVREVGTLANHLHRRLLGALEGRVPDPSPDRIDTAPLFNLHFMKGLGHYHSARYSHALAEFMRAAEDDATRDVARLWLARTYVAERQFAHACLELSRLARDRSTNERADDVSGLLDECRRHVSPDDLEMIQKLVARRVP
jgi:TolB-like protein